MNSLIENLNRLGGEFLNFAWPMLWQSSLLIALVFAVDFALARKLRAAVRHALWLVVLVKLLLPPTLALPTGAAWWLFPAQPAPQPPLARHYSVTYDQDFADASLASLPALPAVATPPPQLNRAGWTLLAAGAVSAGLLAWLLFRWWQLIAKVRAAAPETTAAGSLRDARRGPGLPDGLRIKLVAGTLSPAVCGLFRPVILLPRVLADHLPAAQLRAVLLHEAIHLRRKDIWVNFAQALLQILYWWHPLVWLANARMRRVREEAVDDAVMLALADDAEVYAPTLLEVARLAFQRPLMSLGLVGIMESRSALRQRVERLLNFRAPRRAGLTLVSLGGLFLFSAVALPMGQSQAQSEKDAPATAVVAAAPATTPPVVQTTLAYQWRVPAADPQTNPTAVLMEAAFYRMSAEQFQTLAAQLPPGQKHLDENEWWTTTPAEFARLQDQLKLLGGKPFYRPRVQTISGKEARFFVGNDTLADLEFDCLPVVTGQTVNLTLQGLVTDQSRNTLLTNQFHVAATPENFGGLALRLKSPDSLTGSNVIALIGVHIITNNPAKARTAAVERVTGNKRNEVALQLDQICIPAVHFDHVSLVEALRQLTELAKQNDPQGKGVNLVTDTPQDDLTNTIIRIPSLAGVRLADILDAIVLVADRPIRYSIQEDGVVFAVKTADATSQLFSRTFQVSSNFAAKFFPQPAPGASAGEEKQQPAAFLLQLGINLTNPPGKAVFYQPALGSLYVRATQADLDLVARAISNDTTAAAGTLNPATGLISTPASETRPDSQATTNGDSAANLITKTFRLDHPRSEAEIKQLLVNAGLQIPPATLLISPTGILVVRGTPEQLELAEQVAHKHNGFLATSYQTSHPATTPITNTTPAPDSTQLFSRTFRIDPESFSRYFQAHGIVATNHTSEAIKTLFSQLGLNFDPAQGKSIFYNEKLGVLFIKSTESDLDSVEEALLAFRVQLHVKARFIEVPKNALNDVDKFLLATNTASGQRLGFMSDKNTRMLLKKWAAQKGPAIKTLGEPEITVLAGRQVQMRATDISTCVTNMSFHSYYTNRNGSNVLESAVEPDTETVETGPMLDATMQVLDDGYTINLRAAASLIEFYGYATPPKRMATHSVTNVAGEILNLPNIWPAFQTREQHATVNLWDNQTLVLWLGQGQRYLPADSSPARDEVVGKHIQAAENKKQAGDVIVLITATIIDAAGSRVNTDEGLPFAETGIPPQPEAPGK